MHIKVLPNELAAKIAAGEVIERPVSVVKELVENAIDAQATEISVIIEEAGKSMIQVIDNGQGIGSDEVRIALQRYATSKIESFDDLENIHTLGFRGEALASIAAISLFTLETKSQDSNTGSFYRLEGGKEKEWRLTGIKQGTNIKAEKLFFNVPARLKFMKSDQTEKKRIFDMIAHYALYYANIRFSLTNDKRIVFSTNGNGNRREILSKIFNLETAKKLLEVDHQFDNFHINGFISPLDLTRSNRRDIFLFVNGRLISDISLVSAITRAYQGLIMVGRYPLAIIFIQLDPKEIDINVHPTKAEIRFQNPSQIFSAVSRAVRRTITTLSPIIDIPVNLWTNTSNHSSTIDPAWKFSENQTINGIQPVDGETHERIYSVPDRQKSILNYVPILRPIGQIGRTYIAAEGPDGLYLIDQHAAHERVLFEQMLQMLQMDAGNSEKQSISQFLLDPVSIKLTPHESDQLETNLEIFTELGFNIINFGPHIFQIRAVPVLIQNMDPREIISNILNQEDEEDVFSSEAKKRLVSKICKQAAIKSGQVLSKEEQERLIYDLEKCEMPRTCPHGRPTLIHISVDTLERQFGRRGSI
jgi:DNA mismatch repair protein MutL